MLTRKKIDIRPEISCIMSNAIIAKLIKVFDECSERCWKKVKKFLDDTLGEQKAENSYVITFLKEDLQK